MATPNAIQTGSFVRANITAPIATPTPIQLPALSEWKLFDFFTIERILI